MSDIGSSEMYPHSPELGNARFREPSLENIRWPHEVGKLGRMAAFMVGEQARVRLHRSTPRVERAKDAMRRYNGEGSEVLADKYQFIQIVGEMGYPTPLQGLASPDQTPDERTEELRKFSDPEQAIICKPRNGSGGRGIVEIKAKDLPEFLRTIGQEYIVQEKVEHEAEIRYVREIDEKSHTSTSNTIYNIVFHSDTYCFS